MYGAATRNAASRAAEDGERCDQPRGLGSERHPDSDERHDDDEGAGVFGGRRKACGGARPGKARRALPLVRAERQQERESHEEGDRHVRQHVVRLPDVERHDRHQSRGECRVPGAPTHADPVDEHNRERPEDCRDRPPPEVEVWRIDLIERVPLAARGASKEAEHGDAELHVEVEPGVVEEVRVEITGPHHLDDAGHDFRFVDADIEGDAGAERHEAQQRGHHYDDRQREGRWANIACFPPLAFDHSCSQKNGRRIECVRGRNRRSAAPLRPRLP